MLLDISKDDVSDHPSVKIQLLMSSQRGDMIICPRPNFGLGLNLSHFGLLIPGSTCFLQSFLAYGSKIEK